MAEDLFGDDDHMVTCMFSYQKIVTTYVVSFREMILLRYGRNVQSVNSLVINFLVDS